MKVSAYNYDHNDKVGNRGDLVKHFALWHAIRHGLPDISRFSYLEVHAGRAVYTLRNSGSWIDGIGEYARRCRTADTIVPELDDFYRGLSLETLTAGSTYPGSSSIVHTALLQRGIRDIELHLCDIDTDVCADLNQAHKNNSRVHVYCEDGYQRARQPGPVDLVFIDPPDMRAQFAPYLALIEHCLRHHQPFISWNSLHGTDRADDMSANCARIVEQARSAGIPMVSLRWTETWTPAMCGCQVLLSLPRGKRVVEACRALAAHMGWSQPL